MGAGSTEAKEDVQEALAFLKRRRPTDGPAERDPRQERRRVKILNALQVLEGELESDRARAWSRCREGKIEAGSGDLVSLEEILGFLLYRGGPRGWYVTLDAAGWRTIMGYARTIARLTGDELWRYAPAWVAQLIANAAAPRLVADFDRIVRGAQRLGAPVGQTYEVFIEHRLGSAISEILDGTRPYITASDVVNYFLRDRAFMAELVATVEGKR